MKPAENISTAQVYKMFLKIQKEFSDKLGKIHEKIDEKIEDQDKLTQANTLAITEIKGNYARQEDKVALIGKAVALAVLGMIATLWSKLAGKL